MAAATGLDSAAMKTLAFVTTVFLPPTFVAVSIVEALEYSVANIIYSKDIVQYVDVQLAGFITQWIVFNDV
jgi:hypothetical protein